MDAVVIIQNFCHVKADNNGNIKVYYPVDNTVDMVKYMKELNDEKQVT